MTEQPNKYHNSRGQVSLWDLLTIQPFGSVVGAGIGSALPNPYMIKNKNLLSLHFGLSVILSIILAIVCCWLIRKLGSFAFNFTLERINNPNHQNAILIFVYLVAFIWIFISAILASFMIGFIFK